jgi:hypothetical protein
MNGNEFGAVAAAQADLKKPRFVYGFNNWGIKPDPIEMALSTLPVRSRAQHQGV